MKYGEGRQECGHSLLHVSINPLEVQWAFYPLCQHWHCENVMEEPQDQCQFYMPLISPCTLL